MAISSDHENAWFDLIERRLTSSDQCIDQLLQLADAYGTRAFQLVHS
jgi:hypothetical protein